MIDVGGTPFHRSLRVARELDKFQSCIYLQM
jgi:hypothetical protein